MEDVQSSASTSNVQPPVISELIPHEHRIALPFDALDSEEISTLTSGYSVSSIHSQPKQHYGPIPIRNFIAGFMKRKLRIDPPPKLSIQGEIFLRFPIELQLLILEHLHPLDLYHLSITSKGFRRLVMNPKAIGIWRTAFDQHPDMPRGPPNVSESQWAFMLFCPGICGVCGKHGALTDFAFQKRFCERCMNQHYAYASKFRDTEGNSIRNDHIIWSLIPRSHRYNGFRYITSYSTFSNAKFLASHVDPMIKKVTIMQMLIEQNVPRVEEIFNDWSKTLSAIVARNNEAAEKANLWAMDMYRAACSHCDERMRNNTVACKKRLKNLGHAEQDINYVQYIISQTLRMHSITKLNPKVFRRIKPAFERCVVNRKIARLKKERQEHVQSIYTNYSKSLCPDEWHTLPPKTAVETIEGFKSFFEAEFNERGHVTTEYAVSLFPDFIKSWRANVKETVTNLEKTPRNMDLASSVLSCGGCSLIHRSGKVILGWPDIFRHKNTLLGGHAKHCDNLEWNGDGEDSVLALLRVVGLDAKTTTAEEMDSRGDRFICGNCMPMNRRSVNGSKVYTWRECVLHSEQMLELSSAASHRDPMWFLLTPTATRFAKEHEHPHPLPRDSIWRCNLCAEHYHEPLPHAQVAHHVISVHLIRDPVIGRDVKFDIRRPPPKRRPFLLGMNPAYEFQCKHCPQLPITKLWELEALKIHLRLKHNIPEPTQDTDWVQVRVIEPTPAQPTQPSSPVDESSTSPE